MSSKLKETIVPLIRIIIFSILFIIVFTFVSYMSKPATVDLGNIAGIYAEKKDSLDVIYIGGSACFVYYAPLQAWEQYGIVSYDYGANTIQAEIYKNLVIEALKTQKPKLIIIDARAFQYRDDYSFVDNLPSQVAYRNTLTGMRLSRNKINFIKNNVGVNIKDNNKLSYYFDLIKYHRTFLVNKENIKIMFKKYKNPFNGFYFVPKHEEQKEEMFKTDEESILPYTTNKILIELLEYIKQTDTQYLFVVSPYVEKKDHKKVFNYVERKVKEYGYNFLDANDYKNETNIDFNTDFYNNNHVNIFGAEKYTDFLSNYIINNYSIPNHKNDIKYDYMNEYLNLWHENVTNTKDIINQIIKGEKSVEE